MGADGGGHGSVQGQGIGPRNNKDKKVGIRPEFSNKACCFSAVYCEVPDSVFCALEFSTFTLF